MLAASSKVTYTVTVFVPLKAKSVVPRLYIFCASNVSRAEPVVTAKDGVKPHEGVCVIVAVSSY